MTVTHPALVMNMTQCRQLHIESFVDSELRNRLFPRISRVLCLHLRRLYMSFVTLYCKCCERTETIGLHSHDVMNARLLQSSDSRRTFKPTSHLRRLQWRLFMQWYWWTSWPTFSLA